MYSRHKPYGRHFYAHEKLNASVVERRNLSLRELLVGSKSASKVRCYVKDTIRYKARGPQWTWWVTNEGNPKWSTCYARNCWHGRTRIGWWQNNPCWNLSDYRTHQRRLNFPISFCSCVSRGTKCIVHAHNLLCGTWISMHLLGAHLQDPFISHKQSNTARHLRLKRV